MKNHTHFLPYNFYILSLSNCEESHESRPV
jgi:hypothetical protein